MNSTDYSTYNSTDSAAVYHLSDVILVADDATDDHTRIQSVGQLLRLSRAITQTDNPPNVLADIVMFSHVLRAVVSDDPTSECTIAIVAALQVPGDDGVDDGEIQFSHALCAPWQATPTFAAVLEALDHMPREDEVAQLLLFNFWRWLHSRNYDPSLAFEELWPRS